MLQEYEVRRFTRRCAATDRRLDPGEAYYSALVERPSGAERRDVAAEAWAGPPEDCVGWWRAIVPEHGGRPQAAPNEVLVGLLENWADAADRVELRYVLALLLVRRRVMRIECDGFLEVIEGRDDEHRDRMRVYCPASDRSYDVRVASPDAARLAILERELAELLNTDSPERANAA